MIISIDFDGVCVKNKYPEMGSDCPGAIDSLKRISNRGHQLILNTVRSGVLLEEAINWFNKNNIPLYGVQENPEQKSWTSSSKVFADLYIDASSLGAILTADIDNGKIMDRPYIDWSKAYNFMEKVYRI